MCIYDSGRWISDLDEVIGSFPVLEELEGKTVFITGASGLVCSAVAFVLIRYNETHKRQIRILAAGRDREKILRCFGPYSQKAYFEILRYDACEAEHPWRTASDYIIHGAGNAVPDKVTKAPVETLTASVNGLRSLLEYAREKGVKRVLYISSSEIYGQNAGTEPKKEDAYGKIDFLNPRNSYSVGKRAAENLVISYAAEYGTDTVIVRPGHIYGPTASPEDSRVSSAWAYAAARGEEIVMKSDGSQIRSYCHCLDCASAILTVLLRGEKNTAYNISNPDSIITVRKMAEILSEVASVGIRMDLPTREELSRFNPMQNSSLDSSRLMALDWKGLFDARRGFEHTVSILRRQYAGAGL